MSEPAARPQFSRALRIYLAAVVCVGAVIVAQSMLDSLRTLHPGAWLALAVIALGSGWYRLAFTSVEATIGIDDTFWIVTALLFGPAPATLAIVSHGIMFSVRRRWPARQAAFNAAAASVSSCMIFG